MSDPLELLVVAGGHPYDRSAFTAIFDSDPGIEATAVDQAEARAMLQPERLRDFAAVLFYDMSGVAPQEDPPDEYRSAVEALLERGVGVVLLNHALVSWPSWPLWRELSGSSFLLRGALLDGVATPASGYRGGAGEPERNASTRLRAVTPEHPVLAGLEAGFEICDELYLKTPGFESKVLPLLRSDFAFVQENFSPSPLAPRPEREAWKHPPGSDLVVWARAAGRSPVVASELGDGPSAYACPDFRRLVGNAVRWVASEAGRRWAEAGGGLSAAP